MNYRHSTLIFIMLLTSVSGIIAQPVSETRTVEKSFAVDGDMTLSITNKYGKVHIARSENDSVYISIEMIAKANSPSKLRRLTEGVSFELSSTNFFIIAESKISKGPASLFESIRRITNNLISAESELEINYYVRVPEVLDVKLDNRYGDIYLESLSCDFNIHHSNGSIKTEELTGDCHFNLSFSDATISSLYKASIDASYSDIDISYADDLNITSTSSEFQIETAINIRCNSKRDKFYINGISSLGGESYFSTFNIENLYNETNLNTKYGSFSIMKLNKDFSLVALESSFTEVMIRTMETSCFNLDIKLNNCPAVIPGVWTVEEKVLSEERKEYMYFGIIGDCKPDAKILLSMSRGRLSLY